MTVSAREKPVSARRELANMAKSDFKIFIREAWKVLEPATPLLWNWHIDAIAEHLTAVSNGEITRLVVNIAPGHMKSSIFSVMWPAWSWLQAPDIRWLCASHSLGLAIRDNRNCRSLIESEWYQSCYSDLFSLAPDQNAKSFFENNKRGYRLAVSVGSKGIGKRGTRLLIDDPNDAKASRSDIENTIYWFGQTWLSRLNDQERGSMVVTGQRLDEEDLSGYILKNLSGWEHLNLPTEYDQSRKCHTNIKWDEKSTWKGCDPRTEEGELLWKEKFPPKVLDSLKRGLGVLGYSAQHQQAPVPPGGHIFQKKNQRYFTVDQVTQCYLLETPRGIKPVSFADCWKLCTADLAISQKQSADYTVFAAYAITPFKDLLLLDIVRERFPFNEQVDQLVMFHQKHEFSHAAIESVAYQLAMVQVAINAGLPAQSYHPPADKVTRSTTASIWDANGKSYNRKDATWLFEYEDEKFNFPKAKKDDQVDTHTLAAIVVCTRRTPGILDLNDDKAKIDPTLSIEQIMDAVQIAKEQAALDQDEQTKKDKELFAAGPQVNPFEWAMSHEGGGWE